MPYSFDQYIYDQNASDRIKPIPQETSSFLLSDRDGRLHVVQMKFRYVDGEGTYFGFTPRDYDFIIVDVNLNKDDFGIGVSLAYWQRHLNGIERFFVQSSNDGIGGGETTAVRRGSFVPLEYLRRMPDSYWRSAGTGFIGFID